MAYLALACPSTTATAQDDTSRDAHTAGEDLEGGVARPEAPVARSGGAAELARRPDTPASVRMPTSPSTATSVRGTGTEVPAEATAGDTRSGVTLVSSSRGELSLFGYVEALYQWNFRQPSNGITTLRGFDNRHDTFTLSNIALGTSWQYGSIRGRLALQVGHTPSTYYLAEPVSIGAGAGAAASDSTAALWKYVQQANVGWQPHDRCLFEAGLFLSPIGPEGIAVKDQWNWSRSNLFFGLPFYHTGVRASWSLGELSLVGALYNGWNSVVDGNAEKSVSLQFTGRVGEGVTFSVLYFGGVERPPADPVGAYWRHLLDTWWAFELGERLAFLLHANAGIEPNRLGVSWWAAGAAYARLRPAPWLFVAARFDAFYEERARDGGAQASPIFWPTAWVASQTITLDGRPQEQVSIRLELRHDAACSPVDGPTRCAYAYYAGEVPREPSTGRFVATAPSQTTVTLGMTTWF